MSVSSYALTVFSVATVFAIADFLLPDGKTRKTAKIVFSLVTTITLFYPVIGLLSGSQRFDDIVAERFSVDESVVENATLIVKNDYENEIFDILKNSGYDYVDGAEVDFYLGTRQIEKIRIFYDKSGINEQTANTYISGITSVLSRYYDIDKECVAVFGR